MICSPRLKGLIISHPSKRGPPSEPFICSKKAIYVKSFLSAIRSCMDSGVLPSTGSKSSIVREIAYVPPP